MLTLNSFNERKIYGICQGYNIGHRDRTLTLTVHLVHAPCFWSSSRYSFTFSFLCVFFSFSVLLVVFVSVFLASSLSLKKLTLNFGCRFNRSYPCFTFTQTTTKKNRYGKCYGYNNH